MGFKRGLAVCALLIAPSALADEDALDAEFLRYLAEFSDDQGNALDPELIAIAEDQTNAAKDSDSASASAASAEPLPATPAAAGNAYSQGE